MSGQDVDVVCVCTGQKYADEYVRKLHNSVAMHAPSSFRFFVLTEHDFPMHWARTQDNLGLAHVELAYGETGEHLQQAIHCYELAARGYDAVGLTNDAEDVRQRAAALTKRA